MRTVMMATSYHQKRRAQSLDPPGAIYSARWRSYPPRTIELEQAMDKIRIGVLGASGYTGADLVRLAACPPNLEVAALTANTHAGKAMGEVFPHFFMLDLPPLVR